jgi:hypothetical protein
VFARGFKSWCETTALLQRKTIGLAATEPLNPSRLAKLLGVEVMRAEEVPGVDSDMLQVLLSEDPDSWSAITVSVGRRDLIIVNSSHSGGRPASDLTHELSHILIGHIPARVDITEDGLLILNTYDKNQEEEANWLAASLLLPREALFDIRRRRLTDTVASREYGVSVAMLRFRFNVSGVDFQLNRARGH